MRRSSTLAALGLAALLAGCGARGVPPPHRPSPAAPPPDDLAFVREPLARAGAAGAGAPRLVARGAGAAGDSIGGRIDLPSENCALFVAGASASIEDLDVFVYEDDGSVLGSDESPKALAATLVCPPHTGHAYAFARIAVGHGLYALAVQEVPRARAEAAAIAAGARGGLFGTRLADDAWPGLDEAVTARRRGLGGLWHDVRRVAIPLDPRVPTRLSAVVEAGQCLDTIVVPSDEVAYVELALHDTEGRIVSRDGGDGRAPATVICAETRSEVTFEARPHAGRGLAAVVMSVQDGGSALPPEGAVVRLENALQRSLPDARAALAKRLARAAFEPVRGIAEGTSVVGRRSSHAVSLPAGCSRLDVISGAPAKGLEAWLWSGKGALVAEASTPFGPTLFACTEAETARLDIEGVVRGGPFAVELRPARGSAGILPRHPLAAGRLLSRLSNAMLLASPAELQAATVLPLSPAALSNQEVAVRPGECVAMAIALGPGAEGAELRLVDSTNGEEIALARGTYSALSEACATRTAPKAVHVEARSGAGSADAVFATIRRPLPAR